jgi:hypothetical protein
MGAQVAVTRADGQRAETSMAFMMIINDKGKSFLGNIITVDK